MRRREEKEEEGEASDSGSVSSKLARTGFHGRAPSPGVSEGGPSMYYSTCTCTCRRARGRVACEAASGAARWRHHRG